MGNYIPSGEAEREEMLRAINMTSVEELFSVIPENVRLKELNIPEGISEMEAVTRLEEIAEKNVRFKSVFRGAGAYRHYIPSIVRTITSKEEFVTAYTPYQAEISQGVLQSIFEYQTQMCELTGMDASNASVYDGAVAAAEAVFMCQERKKSGVIIAGTVNPQVLEVVRTYCESRSVPVTVLPVTGFATSPDTLRDVITEGTACVLFQSPNYYGVLEDGDALIEIAHSVKARAIMSFNPISLGLIKTPGEYGADIAVGEGQPLGLPLAFGGPYLGIMTCTRDMMRKLPGRIVGETTDANGRRCFVLTLQAREQHIRREKASSNICSNEALCAMTASVYLAAMGPDGLRRAAVNSAAHAHYLAQELSKSGFKLKSDRTFFNEFVTDSPVDPSELNRELQKHGILGGLELDEGILWCCTECNTKNEIDRLLSVVREVCAK